MRSCEVYTTDTGDVIELPMILPSSWLKRLLKDYPFLLSGGRENALQDQLEAFWTCFHFFQPEHVAFQKSKQELRSTIPLLLHGDEGRYLKKGNYMVCTIETPSGQDGSKKEKKGSCKCCEDPVLGRSGNIGAGHTGDSAFMAAINLASQQHVNDTGNEFLSKFLVFGMSSLVYKKHKSLLTEAFDMVARDLSTLHSQGLRVGDQHFHACTLGVKGDMKFHHQIGNLSRSYYNTGTKVNHPICSLCLAGHSAVGFEDLSDTPAWLDTMHVERPWTETETPSLATIPFQPSAPEAIFRLDLFHCYKCGLGRDLTGSTLILLSQLKYFDFDPDDECNLPARLDRAFGSFSLWCRANGKSPAIHSFSKALLNYKNERSFAWANVKGSDNTLISHWLLFFIKLSRSSKGPQQADLEAVLTEVFASAVILFEVLHSHPLWLHRICAQRCQHHLTVVLRGFKMCAKIAKDLNIVGYGLKPKLHACDHISKDLKRQLLANVPRVLNPLIFSCEANESMVGHVSRISRRVSARTVNTRVLDRVCIKVKYLLSKGKLRPRHNKGR